MTELRMTTDDREELEDWLADFRSQVFPTFEKHGFSFAEAFTVWNINRLYNQLMDVEDAIRGDEDEDL